MGASLIIATISIAIAAATAAYSIYTMRKNQDNRTNMDPASLDDFGVTQSREGQVIPLVYGTVRLNGNIIYYGNLVTEEITEAVGGKGGGGKDITTGYRYYLDVWQGICEGKVEIIDTYINDDKQAVTADDTIFNDGTNGLFPDWAGEYASPLPGIAHIGYKKMFVGENATNLPTVHFIVKRVLQTGINNENMASGSNPAAVIYDILLKAGADAADIDIASFNKAADYWYNRDYGLNITFSSQAEPSEMINRVLRFVDGVLYIDSDGRYALKALDPSDTYVAEMTEDDFISFEFIRGSYDETFNSFRGTFKDKDNHYSQRVVTVDNPANRFITTKKYPLSVDLSAFTDKSIASKRLFEIMKRRSYPAAKINCEVALYFDTLKIGDVVRISHSDYNITQSDFRIVNIDYSTIDKGRIKFQLIQMIEALFDDIFQIGGGTLVEEPDNDGTPFVKQAVVELEYNSETEKKPAFLLLAAREKGIETSFDVLFSSSGTDYVTAKNATKFAQFGTLAEAYPANTRKIDDERGILYTPYKYDEAPKFVSLSRQDLFFRRRIAVMGDEILAFQTVEPEGVAEYRLKGVIRGILNTPILQHNQGDPIWLCEVSEDNVLEGITSNEFYLKFLPRFSSNVLPAVQATALQVTAMRRAATPWAPGRLVATRSGSTISLVIFPNTKDASGAGALPEDAYTDQAPPFPHEGDFIITYNSSELTSDSTNVTIVYAGQVTIYVKHRVGGLISPAKSIDVDVADGEYVS